MERGLTAMMDPAAGGSLRKPSPIRVTAHLRVDAPRECTERPPAGPRSVCGIAHRRAESHVGNAHLACLVVAIRVAKH